ncbi:MAG: sensor histidine kinase [Lewinella sp.]|uniref:sensor histidine kinase n=1 Tax=Lewinella sp. TaxID=2004506 RepID=UPI003D6AA596
MASIFYVLTLLTVLLLLRLLYQQRKKYLRLEGRMEVLSARLSPHFFSNSLNAIESLINLDQKRAASKYLIHFSHLMRKVLLASRGQTTSLSKELAITKHYLAMEELRFKSKFNYQMKISVELKTDCIVVPSLIFQPFLEQAICERIVQNELPSLLSLETKREGSYLCCIITDELIGHGNTALPRVSTKHRSEHSLLKFANRQLLGQEDTKVEVSDLRNENNEVCGTRTLLWLPYKISSHE